MSKFSNMKLRTKVAVGATAVAASLMGGGVALAYFTGGSGTGSGSASTSSTSPDVAGLSATASAGPIAYDGSTSAVGVSITNTHKYSVYVGTGKVTVGLDTTTTDTSGTQCADPANPTNGCNPNYGLTPWQIHNCPTDSFAVAGSAGGVSVPAGDGTNPGSPASAGSGITIKFVDNGGPTNTPENQEGCINFTVPLSVTISA